MAVYYKNGFYDDSDNGFVPKEACEISEDSYRLLLEGQAQGKQIITNQKGYPILVEPQPSQYHTWSGSEWVISPEQQQAVILAEKSAKLAEINQKAQAFVNNLAKYDETPSFERDTWFEQAKEAKAWVDDPTAQTPTLTLIAQMRGVPIDTLRQKAYEKAMAYQTVAAIVAGQRQAYEDRLNAAESLEQIQAIKPVYQLPQGGVDDNH